jgi:hypothetical protein
MTIIDYILETIGFLTVMWFLSGFIYFLLFMDVRIPPKPWHPPLMVKVQSVFVSAVSVPWVAMTQGHLPRGVMMMPETFESQEDADAFNEWRKSTCSCPRCKAERGEA